MSLIVSDTVWPNILKIGPNMYFFTAKIRTLSIMLLLPARWRWTNFYTVNRIAMKLGIHEYLRTENICAMSILF